MEDSKQLIDINNSIDKEINIHNSIDKDIEEQLLQSIIQESLIYSLNDINHINDSIVDFNKEVLYENESKKKLHHKDNEIKLKQDKEYEIGLQEDLKKQKYAKEKKILQSFPQVSLSPNSLRKKRLEYFTNNHHPN